VTLANFWCHGPLFWIAIGFGLFFGVYGVLQTYVVQQKLKDDVTAYGQPSLSLTLYCLAELVFQFWFNFAGGFVGWMAVAFLWDTTFSEYGWRHFIAVVVAFVGVTGKLPHLSTGIRDALASLAKRASGA
jgi:hypothetical protein